MYLTNDNYFATFMQGIVATVVQVSLLIKKTQMYTCTKMEYRNKLN